MDDQLRLDSVGSRSCSRLYTLEGAASSAAVKSQEILTGVAVRVFQRSDTFFIRVE